MNKEDDLRKRLEIFLVNLKSLNRTYWKIYNETDDRQAQGCAIMSDEFIVVIEKILKETEKVK